MCYPGQNFDMSVPVPEGAALDEPGLLDLAERFHDQHEAERGLLLPQPAAAACAACASSARGTTPKPDRFAELGTVTDAAPGPQGHAGRRTSARDFVDTPVYDGPALGPGARDRRARRSIEEPFTVVVVPPGATLELDDLGNYLLRS